MPALNSVQEHDAEKSLSMGQSPDCVFSRWNQGEVRKVGYVLLDMIFFSLQFSSPENTKNQFGGIWMPPNHSHPPTMILNSHLALLLSRHVNHINFFVMWWDPIWNRFIFKSNYCSFFCLCNVPSCHILLCLFYQGMKGVLFKAQQIVEDRPYSVLIAQALNETVPCPPPRGNPSGFRFLAPTPGNQPLL